MKLITITHGDVIYECTIARPSVLVVRKFMESGLVFTPRFDELPTAVKEKILKKVEGKPE